MLKKFIETLKKKYYIIILSALVLALGMSGEKYFHSGKLDYMSGDFYAQRLVNLKRADNSVDLMPITKKTLFINSDLEVYKFIKEMEKEYDFTKFNANWNGMSELQKIFWLMKRLETEKFEPSMYVFSFSIKADDPRDYEYTKEKIDAFVDSYVKFAQEKLEKSGAGTLTVIDAASIIPEGAKISFKRIILKQIIIGGILGTIIGAIIIAGISLRKE